MTAMPVASSRPGEANRPPASYPASLKAMEGRVVALLERMAGGPVYTGQGRTLFVNLADRRVHSGYLPLAAVRHFLGGRGANMWLLANLLDEGLSPEDPSVPLIYGAGMLAGVIPSASRGNLTSWSPESRILLDSNGGDYFASFVKLNGVDHLVLYGRAPELTLLRVVMGAVEFLSAQVWRGLENNALRSAVAETFEGDWGRELAMLSIGSAGERGCLTAGVMAGPKAIHGRGGGGARMGYLNLKGVLVDRREGATPALAEAGAVKPANKRLAAKIMATGVRRVLSERGTPFLYKPSRLLWAMGTKNNSETVWTEALDAEHLDPYRSGMAGCYRCPVRCRPLNDLAGVAEDPELSRLVEVADEQGLAGAAYLAGDGPEYVTLGKFGPNLGVSRPEVVLFLNNVCNDLGLDTSGTGGALAWAFELYEKGLIDEETTGGLRLEWGDSEIILRCLVLLSRREGFGETLASGSRAVELGYYPSEALGYRMTIKGLMQSDPHDARILKGFALGVAVATRGFDHLRNRPTLEINGRINSDPEYKASLYGGPVSGEPTSYMGKERAVAACEEHYAVGDGLGMCRFTTKLFNSPSLPGYPEFAAQIGNATGLGFDEQDLKQVGSNIRGLERLINGRLGLTAADDTVPRRWLTEPVQGGPYQGELIDGEKFEQMKQRYYALCGLTPEGLPEAGWRQQLEAVVYGT